MNRTTKILSRIIFRRIADPVIFGNFFIALCAAGLTLETYLLLGHPVKFDGLVFVTFFSTLALYNFHRLMGIRRIKLEEQGLITGWAARNQFVLLMLIVIGIGGIGFFIFQLPAKIFITLIPLAAIAIFYELPLVKHHRSFQRLRNLWMTKAFLITAVWAGSTVLLPAMNINSSLLGYEVWLTLAERMIFIFILALCFDARDITFDVKDELRTIPIVYGLDRTKQFYKILSAFFFVITFIHYILLGHRWAEGIAMTISIALTYYVVSKTHPKRKSDYYYMFIADGMMLAQFLLTWVLSVIFR